MACRSGLIGSFHKTETSFCIGRPACGIICLRVYCILWCGRFATTVRRVVAPDGHFVFKFPNVWEYHFVEVNKMVHSMHFIFDFCIFMGVLRI